MRYKKRVAETVGKSTPVLACAKHSISPSGRLDNASISNNGGFGLVSVTPAEIRKRLEQNWIRLLAEQALKIPSERVQGSSPPSIFVGRFGYPKVRVGPMLPTESGDTSLLDTPEMWTGKSIDEIATYRLSLIRGTREVKVNETKGRYIETLQDLAMSQRPADSDVVLAKKPATFLALEESDAVLNTAAAPFGPSAPLKQLTVSPTPADSRIESVYYDGDMNATDAVVRLYRRGLQVSGISRIVSMGMLGARKKRKLVPTRWAITATDDMISKELIAAIHDSPSIDCYEVTSFNHLENTYSVILIPSEVWSFELVESWFGPDGKAVSASDFESANGLKHYPSTAGAYFAARLAVAEHLGRTGRKSAALVLREIHAGYVMPMGVWQVREGVRQALKFSPEIFGSIEDAISSATSRHSMSAKEIAMLSKLFSELKTQTRISSFFG